MKARILPIAAVLLGLGTLYADAAEKISVATSSQGSLATTAYVAKQLGYFEAEGLDVDIFDGGGGSNAVAAVVGGSAQIGLVGIKNASEATAKGQTLKAFATAVQGFPASLIVRRDLVDEARLPEGASLQARAAVLKGRTVAVNDIGGSSGDFVRYALKEAGLAERDVTLINLATGAGRLAGLKARKLDAAAANSPEPETALAGGYATVLVDAKRDIPAIADMEYMVYAAREDYLRTHADATGRFLKAVSLAQDVIRNDPAKAKAAYYAFLNAQARGLKLDPAVAELAWTNMLPYMPKRLALSPKGVEVARAFFGIAANVTDEIFIDTSAASLISKAANAP